MTRPLFNRLCTICFGEQITASALPCRVCKSSLGNIYAVYLERRALSGNAVQIGKESFVISGMRDFGESANRLCLYLKPLHAERSVNNPPPPPDRALSVERLKGSQVVAVPTQRGKVDAPLTANDREPVEARPRAEI